MILYSKKSLIYLDSKQYFVIFAVTNNIQHESNNIRTSQFNY